jgi:hypothetical protein
MADETDYRDFYDDEKYLLEAVGERFRQTGKIEPADFYMILVWKANRAKNYHRDRLKDMAGSFRAAVENIASQLSSSSEDKQRLQILLEKWGFALPTASAILTILYPKDFTVYDGRVCKEVGRAYKNWLGWDEYEEFKKAVIANTPKDYCLRDKDKFLIGRSTRNDIERDCAA